jgi:hypothetical protein
MEITVKISVFLSGEILLDFDLQSSPFISMPKNEGKITQRLLHHEHLSPPLCPEP